MLSSQTKDAVTSQAVLNLHAALPGGLSAESLAASPQDVVAEAINKVGFWRRKTEYIQEAARRLVEQPGDARGDVPRTIEELCALKGVGPKMGFLALQAAWNM
jgi:endonuclease-3